MFLCLTDTNLHNKLFVFWTYDQKSLQISFVESVGVERKVKFKNWLQETVFCCPMFKNYRSWKKTGRGVIWVEKRCHKEFHFTNQTTHTYISELCGLSSHFRDLIRNCYLSNDKVFFTHCIKSDIIKLNKQTNKNHRWLYNIKCITVQLMLCQLTVQPWIL